MCESVGNPGQRITFEPCSWTSLATRSGVALGPSFCVHLSHLLLSSHFSHGRAPAPWAHRSTDEVGPTTNRVVFPRPLQAGLQPRSFAHTPRKSSTGRSRLPQHFKLSSFTGAAFCWWHAAGAPHRNWFVMKGAGKKWAGRRDAMGKIEGRTRLERMWRRHSVAPSTARGGGSAGRGIQL